jgi:hypothetical protein
MPDLNLRTFDHCPLINEMGASIFISDDLTNPDGTQIMLHTLDTRFAVPEETLKEAMTPEQMLGVCKGCEQIGLHRPSTVMQDVTVRLCGKLCKQGNVGGLLISGAIA